MKNVEALSVLICSWNASTEVSWNRCQTISSSVRMRAHSGIRQSRSDRTLPPFCPWVTHVRHTRMTIMHTWITGFSARDILNRSRSRSSRVESCLKCRQMPTIRDLLPSPWPSLI